MKKFLRILSIIIMIAFVSYYLICIIFDSGMAHHYRTETSGLGWQLKLFEESTYVYTYYDCMSNDLNKGTWVQKEDSIILNSYNYYTPVIYEIKELHRKHLVDGSLKINIEISLDLKYDSKKLYYDCSDLSKKIDVHKIYEWSYKVPFNKKNNDCNNFRIEIDNTVLPFSVTNYTANEVKILIGAIDNLESKYLRMTYFENKTYVVREDTLLELLNGKIMRMVGIKQ